MTVHVGIVTYNSLRDMPACLAALRAQTCPDVTITVLDNASSDGMGTWLREVSGLRVIESAENLGYGRGHNAIIEACELQPGDVYVALNPDAQLEPGYLETLYEALHTHEAGWGIGQLRLTDADGTHTKLLYSTGHGILSDGYAFNIGYELPQTSAPTTPTEVFGAPGAAVMYRAALIADLAQDGAFFDPDLFLYYEDVDIDWRAQARGWRCLYVPGAVAWHEGSRPSGTLRMHSLANRYGVAIKNATTAMLWLNILPRMILHSILRLVITPSKGSKFVGQLLRVVPPMWRKRRFVPRRSLAKWVAWSAQQPSGSARSLMQRWRSFRGKSIT